MWSEYVYDIAVATRKAGLRTLVVSNGYIQPEPMTDLIGVVGAVKIDLKSFSDKTYVNMGSHSSPCRHSGRACCECFRYDFSYR